MSEPATDSALAFRHVSKRFGGVTALDDVTFDVASGELHAVVGENGAGKSTLMKIAAGVFPDYEGEVLLGGRRVRFANPREAQQAGVAIVHQELNLVEQLSVAANIFLGREQQRFGFLAERAMNEAAAGWLAELDCPLDPRTPLGRLRVGDQQLVEIAKALAVRAQVLVMDEPTSALTHAEVERLDRVIARLRQRGVTILYISHKMDEVFRLADRISVLRDGRFVRTLERRATQPREIAHLMVGRDLHREERPAPRTPGAVLLEVRNLSLPWPGHARRWRLREISLQLRAGEIVGLAGLMGAGRTEIFECLFGASSVAPEGQIIVGGRVIAPRHPAEARAAGLALVSEDRKRLGLFAEMNVRENISLCRLPKAARWGLIVSRRERSMVERSIGELALKTAGSEAAITSLSGGNQQKSILGRWLLTEPRVLLLDDPTRGIDIGAKAEIYDLMDRLCRQGLGILVTSSELPELLHLCDRILVLREGELTAEFPRAEATEQKIMEAATRT